MDLRVMNGCFVFSRFPPGIQRYLRCISNGGDEVKRAGPRCAKATSLTFITNCKQVRFTFLNLKGGASGVCICSVCVGRGVIQAYSGEYTIEQQSISTIGLVFPKGTFFCNFQFCQRIGFTTTTKLRRIHRVFEEGVNLIRS